MSDMSGSEGEQGQARGSSAGTSILGSLKQRREEVLGEQVLDLPVPRWTNPVIHVRYKPVEHGFIRRAQDAVAKAPAKDKYETEVNGNADILIRGCTAVVAIVDGQEYSLRVGDENGEPTLFDDDLAENLGLEGRVTARQVVRALFITQGDILSASQSLVEFSGYRETEADSAVLGE